MVSQLIARTRSLWRGIRRRSDVEADMSDEFRLHQELRAEQLVRSGASPADAARQAKAVATALGVRLGPVLNATVESGMQPKYDMRGRFATMSAEAMVDTPIEPGEVTTEARLQVVYGIE